ncbi:hypothetical protein DIPPA_30346 [Diplonema papillatum]|nr:hypothetical protein DIPPA_30346 [Diplonema papillatum]
MPSFKARFLNNIALCKSVGEVDPRTVDSRSDSSGSYGELSTTSNSSDEASVAVGRPRLSSIRKIKDARKDKEKLEARAARQTQYCRRCVDQSLITYLDDIESFNTPGGETCSADEFSAFDLDFSIPLISSEGQPVTKELVPGGCSIQVTLATKQKYVDLAYAAVIQEGCTCGRK